MTDEPKVIAPNEAFTRHVAGVPDIIPPERDRRPKLPGGLTIREARFVAAYVGGATPLQSMVRAGYDRPRMADAAELMQTERVRHALGLQIEAAASTAQVTAHRIIAEHAAMAFSDVTEASMILQHGDLTTQDALASLPRTVTAAIRKLKITRRYEGKGDDAAPVDTVEIEMHDKHRSLDALAKISDLYRAPEVDDALTTFGEMLRAAVRARGGA